MRAFLLTIAQSRRKAGTESEVPAVAMRGSRGSILGDSLIAMAILAIVVAPIFSALRTGNRVANHAVHVSHAGVLAMNAAERMKMDMLTGKATRDTVYQALMGRTWYTVTVHGVVNENAAPPIPREYKIQVSLFARNIAGFWYRQGELRPARIAWME